MKIVNRGFIFIKPSPAFIEWVKQIDPELLIDEQAEGSVYLIEEEFWDDELILKNYAKKIAAQEMSSITEDETQWFKWSNMGDFEALFSVEMGCSCIDLLTLPLEKEAI